MDAKVIYKLNKSLQTWKMLLPDGNIVRKWHFLHWLFHIKGTPAPGCPLNNGTTALKVIEIITFGNELFFSKYSWDFFNAFNFVATIIAVFCFALAFLNRIRGIVLFQMQLIYHFNHNSTSYSHHYFNIGLSLNTRKDALQPDYQIVRHAMRPIN